MDPFDGVFSSDQLLELVNELMPPGKKIPPTKADSVNRLAALFNSSILKNSEANIDENLAEARSWLAVSERDLKASKILYGKGDYGNAMILLQQATEKLVKAHFLGFFTKSPKEIRSIGHKSPVAYFDIFEEEWATVLIDLLVPEPHKSKINIKGARDEINYKSEEMAMLSDKQIEAILSICDVVEKTVKSQRKPIRMLMENTLNGIVYPLQKDGILDDKQVERLEYLKKHFRVELVASASSLYLMSLITFPHLFYPRYPDGAIKPETYNLEMGIVKNAPGVYKQLNKAIKELKKYLIVRSG